GLLGLLHKADCASLVVETHHAVPLGIAYVISKYRCTIGLRGSALQIGRKIVPIENVVTQYQNGMILPDEFAADDKCLRQSVRRGLHLVLQIQAPTGARAEEPRK